MRLTKIRRMYNSPVEKAVLDQSFSFIVHNVEMDMIEYIDIFVNLCPLQILKISYNVEIDIIEYIDTSNLCQWQIPKTSHNVEINMIEYIETQDPGFMSIADSQNITILSLFDAE